MIINKFYIKFKKYEYKFKHLKNKMNVKKTVFISNVTKDYNRYIILEFEKPERNFRRIYEWKSPNKDNHVIIYRNYDIDWKNINND